MGLKLFIAILISVFTTGIFSPGAHAQLVPLDKKGQKVYGERLPAKSKLEARKQVESEEGGEKQEEISEYEELLFKYLRNIDEIAAEWEAEKKERKRQGQEQIRKQIKYIEENEEEIIRKIEEEVEKRSEKRMFRDERDYEYNMVNLFHGSSDASFRIARHFVDKDWIKDRTPIVGGLAISYPVLTSEWIALLEECLVDMDEDSFWWRYGVFLLCHQKEVREKYLPIMTELLEKENHAPGLSVRLYEYDKQIGDFVPVISRGNLELYKKYASPEQHFSLRMTAGGYALRVHNYETALKVYLSVSGQDFIGKTASKGLSSRAPEDDYDLAHSKYAAQFNLIYKIKNEKAFKEIWDTSNQNRDDWLRWERIRKEKGENAPELIEESKMVNKGNYSLYDREESAAQRLLSIIDKYISKDQ